MSSENPEELSSSRQNLVDEAAKFLSNPNVARHADDQKTAFLRKKGLTEEEIQLAFAKAKVNMPAVGSASGPPVQQSSLPPIGLPVPAYPLQPPPSIWIKARDICNFVLIISGVSYGAYHLYKNFIGPLLTGRRQKSVEESMIELQQSVVSVLKEVQTTLASLENTLSVQSSRIQGLSEREEKNTTTLHQLEELKAEVTSLKALLINRRTFPSTPSMSPSIPSWQRTKAAEKTVENPPIDVSTLSSKQDEVIEAEERKIEDDKIEGEDTSDDANGESGIEVINAPEEEEEEEEEDTNSSSVEDNGLDVVENITEDLVGSYSNMSH